MQATLGELARLVGGTLIGDAQQQVCGAAPLADAQTGDITLVDRPERLSQLSQSAASAAVVPRGVVPSGMSAIQADDVHAAFAALILHFRPLRTVSRGGISPQAVVAPTARLGENVEIHPFATIADDVEIGAGCTIHSGVRIAAGCRIGAGVTIFPNAVLYEDTVVGDGAILHAGVVLGAYGFGYTMADGRHVLSAQLGNVVVERNVEIGAGTTIDRGTYGATMIGEGTKIDDQVMIAHNCRIGRHNLLCSQVGIAGSTTTGDYVVMAGQVGVRDHVRIGHRAVLGAMAGVINDIPDDVRYVGIPATPEREQMVKQAAWTKLPEMRKQLKTLEKTVARLVAEIAQLEHPDQPSAGDGDGRAAA